MFDSTKIGSSPRTNKTNLYNNLSETANGISKNYIQPKITSTPLVRRDSIFATPPKHSILSPRRYSLSEIATPPRSNRQDLTKVITPGPLLASTKYNVNVSTYEDTKSPGLAGRIVQYNEEIERERGQSRPPTHQAKYGSPGLFPVVHLFKKKLPTLDQKPRHVTIRIASPDYARHHSQEYNRKLLEGIVKPGSPIHRGSPFSPSSQSNSSTRSVLDALKEISRKRIHSNEEYDLNEDTGKRLRTMNNGDSNKRVRDNTSLDKSPSPSKPTSKRVCMYDEYAASCSSTDFSFGKTEQPGPKRKSISISTLTENVKESKQVKLINAETQTVVNETTQDTGEIETTAKADENKPETSEETVEKTSPLKIFDDAPLERIRKNRLAALMGSLTGKEPVLLPKPDYASVLNSQVESSDVTDSEAPKSAEKPLVSILSSPKKSSPTKSSKHVHFSVPESTSQTDLNSTSVLSFPTVPSSISVAAPVSSASDTTVTFESVTKTSRETPAPPSSPVGLQPSDTSAIVPIATFVSESGSNSSSVTSIVSKESSTSSITPQTNFALPNFQFKPPATSAGAVAVSSNFNSPSSTQLNFSSSVIIPPSVKTSPPKVGGFKFDLAKPVTTSATLTSSAAPMFSFGSTQSNKTGSELMKTTQPSINAQNSVSGTFAFGGKATTTTSSTTGFSNNLSFGTTTTSSLGTAVVPASAVTTFKFGPSSTEGKSAASAGFSVPQSSTATFGVANTVASTPGFGTMPVSSSQVPSTAVTAAPAYPTTKAPFFSFGAPKTTSAPSGFGVPTNSTAAPITIGAPSSTSSGFATPTSNFLNTTTPLPTPGFGVTTNSSTVAGGFGAPSTTSSAGFGSNTTLMFGANKPVSPFGVSTTATPAFGTSSTVNAPFGKSSTPQFGQNTTQSSFGTPSTTASFGATNAFGSTTTTASSVFGGVNNSASMFATKTGGFGTPSTNANIFGGSVNTQPSGFGTSTSNPVFGPAVTSPFGSTTKTTTTPSFGSSNTPSFNFGAKTTASSSFGSGNFGTTTTTASTGFCSSTTPAFGNSNSFSGGTNFCSGNAFGSSTTPTFGVATTTTQSNFGATATPSFGTANTAFNAVDKNSVFGNPSANSSAFGNASLPFGSSNAPTSFGAANTQGFGTNTAVSAFAKPQTAQNAFGAPTSNSFGTSNNFGATQQPGFGSTNPPSTQNAVFSFGATAPPKPPGVFSFGAGATNEIPKPSFNFTGGSAAPTFGSGGGPSFGSSGPAQPFGASGIPQFNSPQTVTPGMFSIGSGSSSGKARTHLKPKRRT